MGEIPILFDVTFPKARKEHICCECKKTIAKGEKYERFSGLWNDIGFGTYKSCMECSELRNKVMNALDDHHEGVEFGVLHEYIKNGEITTR